jgi:glycosyltransferase involved in cell wall biosynthesis
VPPGDSSALAAALERLAVDPDRRDELGAQARISAEARFRPEAFASAMLGVWKELATR